MENIFINLVNMSIVAGWMILAVILLRPLTLRAPKWISFTLWALVALRLLLPFSVESVVSLVPSKEPIPQEILTSPAPEINTQIPFFNSTVNPIIYESLAPAPTDSVNPMQIVAAVASYIWLAGIIAMLIYAAVSFIRIKLSVREAYPLDKKIYACDKCKTPFILGVIRPKIYLPSKMNEEDKAFVIAHEKAHLKRLDHIWKPLGFLILTVYWFNPLIWVAYILLCRDIELACDEKVIGTYSEEEKKAYSTALLNCSAKRSLTLACPVAFGEVGVKARIKNVLNYKKPAFWIIIIALVMTVAAAIFLLTDPKNEEKIDMEAKVSNGLEITATGSSSEDGKLVVEELILQEDGALKIKYHWLNTRIEDYLTYGEAFSIEQKKNGEYVPLKADEGAVWHMIAYTVPPAYYSTMGDSEDEEYITYFYTLTEGGKYRFVKEFSFENDKTSKREEHTTWVEFTITDKAVEKLKKPEYMSVVGKTYTYSAEDPIHDCTLTLDEDNKTYRLFLGVLSSYYPIGTYEDMSDKIVLTESDPANPKTFVFRKSGYNYIFDEEESTGTLSYVPDGAVFSAYNDNDALAGAKFDFDSDNVDEDISIILSSNPEGKYSALLSVGSPFTGKSYGTWLPIGSLTDSFYFTEQNNNLYLVIQSSENEDSHTYYKITIPKDEIVLTQVDSYEATGYHIVSGTSYYYSSDGEQDYELTLDKENKLFSFSVIAQSSAYATGHYTETKDQIKLDFVVPYTEPYSLVFKKVGEALVYDNSVSDENHLIQNYDGATFTTYRSIPSASISFDLNGDGENETVSAAYGPTYGLNSIRISVYDTKTDKKTSQIFVVPFGFALDDSCFLAIEGKLYLKLTDNSDTVQTLTYNITQKDEEFIVTEVTNPKG